MDGGRNNEEIKQQKHTTLMGKVVYKRKKHPFTVKRIGNIAVTLSNNDQGTAQEWRFLTKIAEMNWRGRLQNEGFSDKLRYFLARLGNCDPQIASMYNFLSSIERYWQEANKWLAWVPWIGQALDVGTAVQRWMHDETDRLIREKYQNCRSGSDHSSQSDEIVQATADAVKESLL